MNVRKAAQIFSDAVTHALRHYRELPATKMLFAGFYKFIIIQFVQPSYDFTYFMQGLRVLSR